jgi:hypothetical protein
MYHHHNTGHEAGPLAWQTHGFISHNNKLVCGDCETRTSRQDYRHFQSFWQTAARTSFENIAVDLASFRVPKHYILKIFTKLR